MEKNNTTAALIIRWTARVISAFLVLFSLFIFFGETIGSMHSEMNLAIRHTAAINLLLMLSGIIGLALAWKWELTGSILACLSYLVLGFFDRSIFMFPMAVFPMTSVLFIIAWFYDRFFVKLAS
jgi:hypothetical protein